MNKHNFKETYPLVYGRYNPILRTTCSPVHHFTKDIHDLHDALAILVWEYEGVGLAAPQIGHTVRMAAVTQRDTSSDKWKLKDEFIMINPVIVGQSEEKDIEEEGCLSLPGVTGDVQRPISITVKFQTIDGKEHIKKVAGYNARIVLHEMDHLDGIV